ncbi:hypothetical protein GQ600_903 [Phytophthora cactorum]|nr:hypothetical protein GQ600_903 [Phytophthora cactorum]
MSEVGVFNIKPASSSHASYPNAKATDTQARDRETTSSRTQPQAQTRDAAVASPQPDSRPWHNPYWKIVATLQYQQRIESERECPHRASQRASNDTNNDTFAHIFFLSNRSSLSNLKTSMKSPQSAPLLVACDDAATLEAALDLVVIAMTH